MGLGELSRLLCAGHTGHVVLAVATGLVLLVVEQVAMHQLLQACPGLWALRSPGSGKALSIPVTHLLKSQPTAEETVSQAVVLDGAVLLATCEYTHSSVPSRQRVPLQPDWAQLVFLSPASLGTDIPNPLQGCKRSRSTATPS